MNKRSPLLLLVLSLVWGSFVFSGCAQPNNSEPIAATVPSLEGLWISAFDDGFEISGTSFKHYMIASSKSVMVGGTIANAPDMNAASGVIIIKITETASYNDVPSYTIGKYFGIRWKNLTAGAVSESTAYKPSSNYNAGMDTMEAAEAEYTEANGYFPTPYYSDCIKQ